MERPESTIRTFVLLAALLAAVLLLVASGANAKTSSDTRECQHPLTTGQEAIDIRKVDPKTACKVVRELARFIENGAKPERLYGCVGTHGGTRAGRPVLKIHHFRGWKLTVVQKYGLQMSRGAGSFDVTGTDFPLNCT